MVLEKTPQSPLVFKEFPPVCPKGNQSWIFIGRTDAAADAPILWQPDAKNWLIWKDPDAGKDWRQEEKGMTEDEMVGWHHWLNGHKFEQAPGVGDGQGSLACCSPWVREESDRTEELNWTDGITNQSGDHCHWNDTLLLTVPKTAAWQSPWGHSGEVPGLNRRWKEWREVVGKSICCGFLRKDKADKQAYPVWGI